MNIAIRIAIAAVLLSLMACSGSNTSGSAQPATDQKQITDRVNSLISHFNSGDGKAILDDDVPASARRTCSDKDAKDTVNTARQQLQAVGGKLSVKSVNDISVDGNKATANVAVSLGSSLPDLPSLPLSFVKDGGSWKVDPPTTNGCNGLIPTTLG